MLQARMSINTWNSYDKTCKNCLWQIVSAEKILSSIHLILGALQVGKYNNTDSAKVYNNQFESHVGIPAMGAARSTKQP